MKATYDNSFCMDHNCMHWFEDMCMLCISETGDEIKPYNIAYIEKNGRGSSKDCKSFKRGTNLAYEVEFSKGDF